MLDSILCRCEKNTPAWCEQKWPNPPPAPIFPLESNPCSSLITSVSVRFSVHTTQECVMKTYPICDDLLSRPKKRSITPTQKSIRNRRFVCKRKPYPIGAGTSAIRYNFLGEKGSCSLNNFTLDSRQGRLRVVRIKRWESL